MSEIIEVKEVNLYNAVYEACLKANIYLPKEVYNAILVLGKNEQETKGKINKIIKNCELANKKQRPLCQDTGQVIVFLEIGRNMVFKTPPAQIINQAISDCYKENFFRKSVVKDAFFDRQNTQTNTPAIIYTEITDRKDIKIDLLIKGGGAENMSTVKMLNPSATEEDIYNTIRNAVESAGENACPPLFLGVGIGGTIDYAGVLSKKAFFTNEHSDLAQKIKNKLNQKLSTKIADIKILSAQTHIACLPVCVTVNCHSSRHASIVISENDYKITTEFAQNIQEEIATQNLQEIHSNEIEKLKTLNKNEEILLSGIIYTARDMAHKRLCELLEQKKSLPFELKNSIIFYAGPCPKKESEPIGPIGPTTAKRMDKFAPILYDNGVLATIGKGNRDKNIEKSIKENKAIYFSTQGGIASLLQNCIKSCEVIAFEELGAEAIYKLEVEKLPLKVELI